MRLSSAIDQFAPQKVKRFQPFEICLPEWMDAEYRKERSIRRKLEKQHKTYRSDLTLQRYKEQRDHCVYLANSKIKSYYSNMLASTENQSFKTV